MIQLTDAERKIIKLCKGHYQYKYPFTGNWSKTLRPIFVEIYGFYDKKTYHSILFNKLLEIQLKISDDQSGTNLQIRNIFYAAFGMISYRSDKRPIERAIAELCALIQCNLVFDNGNVRYEL